MVRRLERQWTERWLRTCQSACRRRAWHPGHCLQQAGQPLSRRQCPTLVLGSESSTTARSRGPGRRPDLGSHPHAMGGAGFQGALATRPRTRKGVSTSSAGAVVGLSVLMYIGMAPNSLGTDPSNSPICVGFGIVSGHDRSNDSSVSESFQAKERADRFMNRTGFDQGSLTLIPQATRA